MKRILLLLFILLSLSEVRASDTLTVRQVFNFNVGDTFDYKWYSSSVLGIFNETPLSNYGFKRYIISSRSLSGDTLIYYRNQVYPYAATDTLIYIHIDSPITYNDTCSGCNYNFSTSIWTNNSLYNEIDYGTGLGESGTNNRYVANLGVIYNETWFAYPPTDYSTDSTVLIYYSTANGRFGTPYTIADNSPILSYKPIPEDCAIWTKQAMYPPILNPQPSLYEQIRTSTKYYQGSHTYIELLYRSYDSYLNSFTSDSIIGYFRNDTAGRKVLFRNTLNGSDTVLYDFTLVSGDNIASNMRSAHSNTVTLDSVEIGGNVLDIWSYTDVECCYTTNERSYAEGIGGLQGFLINKYPVPLGNYNPGVGSLISFCVCGQTLYPDIATGTCQLLTGINNITNTSSIYLYPNPTIDQLHLTVNEVSDPNYRLILTDILGQEVYTSSIMQSETTHDMSKLPSGIYTWHLVDINNIIRSGKVVKE